MKHIAGRHDPLATPHPWYVLLEVSSSQARQRLAPGARESPRRGAWKRAWSQDGTIAQSAAQARDLWRIREGMVEAQKSDRRQHQARRLRAGEPGRGLHRRGVGRGGQARCPACALIPFGHVGDGNIHFNLAQPVGAATAPPSSRARRRVQPTSSTTSPPRSTARSAPSTASACLKRDELPRYKPAARARADAPDQARARSRRHHESRQDPRAVSDYSAPARRHALRARRDRGPRRARAPAGLRAGDARSRRCGARRRRANSRARCWRRLNRSGDRERLPCSRTASCARPRASARPMRNMSRAAGTRSRSTPEHGGQGLPQALATAVGEMWSSANTSFALCPILTMSAVELLAAHGTAEQKRLYLAQARRPANGPAR